MAVVQNIFDTIGDTLIIDNKSIMMGVVSIDSFSDVTIGVTSNKTFDKTFTYTIDGVNWSEWLSLTNDNLNTIIPKDNQIFRIRYKYIRTGTDDTGTLEFVSLDLNCTYSQQPISQNFNNLPVSQFFEYFNLQALQWANNVLTKVYKRGIVPKYITRDDNNNWDDEDYIDLFWSIIYLLAIVVNYGRKFEDVIFDKKTLQEYLKQKGLFLNKNRDLAQLNYLCENFNSEIRKRGTISIAKFTKNITIPNGELTRLLDVSKLDEFIFCLPETEKSSFTVGKSSPCYRGTNRMTNCIKDYEYTADLGNIHNYPLIDNTKISQGNGLDGKSSMKIVGVLNTQISGIGSLTGSQLPIIIDPSVDYEITFMIKKSSLVQDIDFGVKGFDLYQQPIAFAKVNDQVTDSNFFFQQKGLNTIDTYYLVRGIIYNSKQPQLTTEQAKLNIGYVNNLIFKPTIRVIEPYLVVNNNSGSTSLTTYIYDFKIRPLKTPFSRCFINKRNNIIIYSKNNNTEFSQNNLEDNIRKYLIPYNSSILNVWL